MHDTSSSSRFSFDQAAVWFLALSAFLAVAAYLPFMGVSFYSTKVTAIALAAILAFIAYVVARMLRGSVVVPPMGLLGAVWLLPAAYLASALFSGAGLLPSLLGVELEPDTFAFVLLLALLATLSALALRRDRDYQAVFAATLGGIALALATQVLALAAGRFIPELVPTWNLAGTFREMGMLAGMGVILSLLGLRFLPLAKGLRVCAYVLIAVAAFVLVLVNSPLVWTLTGLAALGLFVEALLRRRTGTHDDDLEGASVMLAEDESPSRHSRAGLVPAAAVLLASVFFLIGGSTVGSALATALGAGTIDVRPSWQSTFLVGSHTYASSPLFGSGPGTFGEEWLKFRDRSLNDTIFWNVDFGSGIGYIPTSFVTTGLLGVVAWLVLIGFFLYAGARLLLFRLSSDPVLRFASVASFVAAGYALALALFSTPGPAVLAMGFVMLGTFISALRHGKEKSEWGIVFSRSPKAGFAIVFLLTLLLLGSVAAAYVVVERFVASAYYGAAVSALSRGDLDKGQQALGRSMAFAPSARAYQLGAALGIERMRAVANDTELSPTAAQQQFQEALSGAIASGVEATRMAPEDYRTWSSLGQVYQSVAVLNVEGAYEGAKETYERAIALNPTSPVLPYVIAQLEIAEGNDVAAEERLLSSINLKRDYIPGILLLSQLEIQMGKASEALQAAEAAAYFAPNDSAVLLQVGLLRSGTGDYDGATEALARAVDLNPQYANARFFLAAMHAMQGEPALAIQELEAVALMSEENAAAVADDLASLRAGENPFPLSRLRTLGIPQPPVAEVDEAPAE